jgi:spore germination cell wall hydrolase CwlJ-like protein
MNPVGQSTMYHANYVNPSWAKSFDKVAVIEEHVFYAKKG